MAMNLARGRERAQQTALAAPHGAGHTGRMELYTLRLNRPLEYRALAPSSAAEILGRTAAAPDGDEFVMAWEAVSPVNDGPDGPRVASPLPAPAACGALAAAAERESAGAGEGPKLEMGAYLFCQGRAEDEGGLAELLEWFARESWWTKERYRAPLYLRLVREDGKLAAQVLARKVED